MEYSILGKTGARVSRIGFGGAPAGLTNYLQSYDPEVIGQREQVVAAIEEAIESGITYFDTAPAYGSGAGEEIFGEALDGVDADLFVATKVVPGTDNIGKSLEDSLRRLRMDSVDLLQIHGNSYSKEDVSSILGSGGMLDQMEQLKSEGLVRFIGFTTEDNNAAMYEFIECGRFDTIQMAYNFIHQHPAEPTRPFGSIYEAEFAGMGIITMRALTSGLVQKWVRLVNPNDDFDYSAALMQFVLSNPMVDVALVGMRTPEEVRANVAIVDDTESRIDLVELHEKYV